MPGLRRSIILTAYDADGGGRLIAAFSPRHMKAVETAVYVAQTMMNDHDGVMVVEQDAGPAVGEADEAIILFRHGRIPEVG